MSLWVEMLLTQFFFKFYNYQRLSWTWAGGPSEVSRGQSTPSLCLSVSWHPHRKNTVASQLLLQEPGDCHLQVRLLSLACVTDVRTSSSLFLTVFVMKEFVASSHSRGSLGSGCRLQEYQNPPCGTLSPMVSSLTSVQYPDVWMRRSGWNHPFFLSLFTSCSQQTTIFGDRCLQTIGRCWPQLHSLSVGGAGCGTQGLLALG